MNLFLAGQTKEATNVELRARAARTRFCQIYQATSRSTGLLWSSPDARGIKRH